MGVTETVARFVATATLDSFPSAVIERARLCLLDTLGVAVVGAETTAARLTRGYARRVFPPGPATVLGTGWGLRAEGAALANGVSASALDMDDGHRVALAPRGEDNMVGHCAGHPGAVVIPAALAAAEEAGATGATFLASILVAYEVGIRISAARRISIVLENATGNWGAYAAALAAAKVHALDPRAIMEALGLAGSFGPNPQARVTFRSMPMVKESIGWSVVSGLASTALAAQGFTGLETVLDDPRAFSPTLFADLGHRHLILQGYFKPYAACRMAHAAVDAVLRLVHKHGIHPSEVREVVVRTSHKGTMLDNPRPSSLEGAQYSVPFCIAVALHTGAIDPETLHEGMLDDPAIRAMADRVRLALDPVQAERPELELGFPVKNRAEVVVRTRGAEHVECVEHPRGDPENPLTPQEVREKFRRLTRRCWSRERADAILATIARLEDTTNIAELSRLLSPDLATALPCTRDR